MKPQSQTEQITYHLAPDAVWRAQMHATDYVPEMFLQDGFIHCTNGEQNLIQTGNRYYQADARPMVVLVIDLLRVGPPIKYEDPQQIFPHIYGKLNRSAIVEVRVLERNKNGTFLRIGDPLNGRDVPTGDTLIEFSRE